MRAIRKYHPLRAAKRQHGDLTVAFIVTGYASLKRLHKAVSGMAGPELERTLAKIQINPRAAVVDALRTKRMKVTR